MALAKAFQSELAAGSTAQPPEEPAALEARLVALVARGQAAHPALSLEPEPFVRHLARCLARAAPDAVPLEKLEVEDLFLACACLGGVPGAAQDFEDRCGPRIRTVLATVARPDMRGEVEQRVRDLLLVGTVETPAKLANYGGQGPLDRWVAVVAQRQVVTMFRSDEVEQRAREGAALETAVAATVQPELAFAKERYRAEFERAMGEALAKLGERDRLLMRLHLVSGISVEQIGKMYGVSQSTASRWLAQARDAVSTEVQATLRERLRLSPEEMASLAGLVASQLELSMSRLLRTG